jgi:hypothetical protein
VLSPELSVSPPREFEQIDLRLEYVQDPLLDRAAGDEVGQQYVVLLTHAVQPAQALLDLHRVPRQVHVDHDMAELQVAPLPCRLGGQQHGNLIAERGDRGVLVAARQAAVIADGRDTRGLDLGSQRVERVPKGREYQHLLAPLRVGAQPGQQLVGLAGATDRPRAGGEVGPPVLVKGGRDRGRAGADSRRRPTARCAA